MSLKKSFILYGLAFLPFFAFSELILAQDTSDLDLMSADVSSSDLRAVEAMYEREVVEMSFEEREELLIELTRVYMSLYRIYADLDSGRVSEVEASQLTSSLLGATVIARYAVGVGMARAVQGLLRVGVKSIAALAVLVAVYATYRAAVGDEEPESSDSLSSDFNSNTLRRLMGSIGSLIVDLEELQRGW